MDLRLLERSFIILFLFALTNAHEIFLVGPRDEILGIESAQDRMFLRLSWIAFYLPLVLLILAHGRRVTACMVSDPWLASLLALGVLSATWSISGEDTLRRSLALMMTAGLGYYVAARYDAREQLRMLAIALSFAIGIGLAAGILAPEIGIMSFRHAGDWRGVFVNKNQFGLIAALGSSTMLLLFLFVRRPTVWPALGLLMSLAALVLSGSVASLVTTLAVAGVLTMVWAVRRSQGIGPVLMIAGVSVCLVLVVVSSVETVLAWSGRDTTLTGRTMIWQEAWELIRQRPLLGFGYGAFWSDSSEPALILQEAVRWQTPTAHSGYLDLMLELGMAGLALFLLSVSTASFRILAQIRHEQTLLVPACSAAITFVLVYDAVETAILEQHHLLTFLYVWAAAAARGVASVDGPRARDWHR